MESFLLKEIILIFNSQLHNEQGEVLFVEQQFMFHYD